MTLVLPFPYADFDSPLRERVANSAAAMDYLFPGWADKISLESFDITDPMLCVIGQAVGEDYCSVMDKWRDIPGSRLSARYYTFSNGTSAWRTEIEKRKNAAVSISDEDAMASFKMALDLLRARGYTVNVTVQAPMPEVITL